MLLLGIIAGLLILTFLVVIHELGHAIVARRNGVTVEEFGVGFPPRAKAWKVKKSFLGRNVEYSLNWLPIGGFVKLQGEHDEDGGHKGDFGRASFWAKTKIMLAGVAVNWLAAIILLTGLAWFGIPKVIDDQFQVAGQTTVTTEPPTVQFIGAGSPAETAGLKLGDEMIRVGGEEVSSDARLSELTEKNRGRVVVIQYERSGSEYSTSVKLRESTSEGEGYLGVGTFQREWYRSSWWSAPIVGVGLTKQLSWETFKAVGSMATNFVVGISQKLIPNDQAQRQADERIAAAGQNVAGPVGLVGIILPGLIQAGPQYTVLVIAVISLSLAVLNTLPIPGLDGGRWALIAIYRAMNRPLSKEREEQIVGAGMLFLFGIFILITIADVGKFF
ncbi:hypothetical protein CR983_01420 [Candidatus Saccharibacteria bacterium]|nr:MAG: hypothetical protein CR983_01420 [Candidatus Saccharibacteria bacterium]